MFKSEGTLMVKNEVVTSGSLLSFYTTLALTVTSLLPLYLFTRMDSFRFEHMHDVFS